MLIFGTVPWVVLLVTSGLAQRPQTPTFDYYKMLGVKEKANGDEIKKAYRKRAKKTHPDKVKPELRQAASDKFTKLAEAYETLSDPTKRRTYDQTRHADAGGGGAPGGGGFGGGRRPGGNGGFGGGGNPFGGFGGGGFGGGGFGSGFSGGQQQQRQQKQQQHREQPRSPPPPPARWTQPPQVAEAQRRVGRVASLSTLRKLVLDADTGVLKYHLFHAFYSTANGCDDRLSDSKFPYPFTDPNATSPTGARRWGAHVKFTKTDLSGSNSGGDAANLAVKLLGAKANVQGGAAQQCPQIVFVRRGARLAHKDAVILPPQQAVAKWEEWAWERMKVTLTWRNAGREKIDVYWHVGANDAARYSFSLDVGATRREQTYPTQAFTAIYSSFYGKAQPKNISLPDTAVLLTHIVAAHNAGADDQEVVVGHGCVDARQNCAAAATGRGFGTSSCKVRLALLGARRGAVALGRGPGVGRAPEPRACERSPRL
ncbi:hypothetical protein M885DRAFT_516378 [Pelagophyceae sp. CCMP2097]|nr:hypothetical protein M885DRAFT_516378 [Pelagophyceae sp. CCMP2097]